MRAPRTACLACLLLAGLGNSVEADEPLPGITRFAVKARLDAQPAALESPRFVLRASLSSAPPAMRTAQPGWVIRAKLQSPAKALCEGPGFIFGNGFEAP